MNCNGQSAKQLIVGMQHTDSDVIDDGERHYNKGMGAASAANLFFFFQNNTYYNLLERSVGDHKVDVCLIASLHEQMTI